LVFLDMASGLRRGELAGVKWHDFDFAALDIEVQRSAVNQIVGQCKTEAHRGAFLWTRTRLRICSHDGRLRTKRRHGESFKLLKQFGVPDGIRTRVTAVKGIHWLVTY